MATTLKTNRILIVEDDPSVLGLMTRHFRRNGFQVEQAAAAEDVMHRFSADAEPFDVVLTDVHLPGESGVELAQRIRQAKPRQAVVFMTGDADAGIARQALQNGAAGFLLKPFEFSELDRVVRHAVERGASAASPRFEAVVRGLGQAAHVTVPARVLLAPERPRHHNFMARARVAVATAAMLGLAWLAGSALAPVPATAAATSSLSAPQTENRPIVVPVIMDRTVYVK